MPVEVGPISELQRLTVSLRGGFEQQNDCLVFHFTGQLDAYSETQFMEHVVDVLKASNLLVVDVGVLDLDVRELVTVLTAVADAVADQGAEGLARRPPLQVHRYLVVRVYQPAHKELYR